MNYKILALFCLHILFFTACNKEDLVQETSGRKIQFQIEKMMKNNNVDIIIIYRFSLENDAFIIADIYSADTIKFKDGLLNYNNTVYYNLSDCEKVEVIESKSNNLYEIKLYF